MKNAYSETGNIELNPSRAPRDSSVKAPVFAGGEVKTQRGEETCLKGHEQEARMTGHVHMYLYFSEMSLFLQPVRLE